MSMSAAPKTEREFIASLLSQLADPAGWGETWREHLADEAIRRSALFSQLTGAGVKPPYNMIHARNARVESLSQIRLFLLAKRYTKSMIGALASIDSEEEGREEMKLIATAGMLDRRRERPLIPTVRPPSLPSNSISTSDGTTMAVLLNLAVPASGLSATMHVRGRDAAGVSIQGKLYIAASQVPGAGGAPVNSLVNGREWIGGPFGNYHNAMVEVYDSTGASGGAPGGAPAGYVQVKVRGESASPMNWQVAVADQM